MRTVRIDIASCRLARTRLLQRSRSFVHTCTTSNRKSYFSTCTLINRSCIRCQATDPEKESSNNAGSTPPVLPSEISPPDIAFETDSKDKPLLLPKEVIEQLRYSVFGFDSFFVTGVENYEQNGCLFKGNLKGDPAKARAKLAGKLQQWPGRLFPFISIDERWMETLTIHKALLGNEYTLYLLENREEKPVVVVLPTDAVKPPEPVLPQSVLAGLFGLVTLVTTLNCNGFPLLAVDDGSPALTADLLLAALPGSLAFLGLLAVHEWGHRVAAKEQGVELGLPVLVPAGLGLLGSFGGITNPVNPVPDRTALLKVFSAGPLYGSAAALAAVVLGLLLTKLGLGGVTVEPAAFQDSLLVGLLGQLALGEQLQNSTSLNLNPLLLAGWAALLVNGLNAIPVGDLDGARISAGLWGRRASTALSTVTLLLLGLAGIIDTLALFWVLIVVFLQRGPIAPQLEELSQPQDTSAVATGIFCLLLPLLTLLPYPGQFGVPVDAF